MQNKKPQISRPRKSLGQNFLKDPKILKKIVDLAQIKNTDVVLEIGPGEGTLTKFLIEKAKNVIAVEKDKRMVNFLNEKFKKEIDKGELEVVAGDILDLAPKDIFSPQAQKCMDILLIKNSSCSAQSASQSISKLIDSKYVLVGNIPYYITGSLFKKVLESENQPKSITFVVQKEVAERIIARDGKESILSISVKVYGEPEYGGTIKAGSFYPKPKVDSAIISIRNINRKKFENINKRKISCSESPRTPSLRLARLSSQDFSASTTKKIEKNFFDVLKTGFAHKRKLLIKNLGKFVNKKENQKLEEIFDKCNISKKARAEDLDVEKWICLTKEIF